eukprot:scaffold1659_cov312-Pavlova_lutheri.AAC.2
MPASLDGSEMDARENTAPSKSKRRNGYPAGGSSTSCTWIDEGRTMRELESLQVGLYLHEHVQLVVTRVLLGLVGLNVSGGDVLEVSGVQVP